MCYSQGREAQTCWEVGKEDAESRCAFGAFGQWNLSQRFYLILCVSTYSQTMVDFAGLLTSKTLQFGLVGASAGWFHELETLFPWVLDDISRLISRALVKSNLLYSLYSWVIHCLSAFERQRLDSILGIPPASISRVSNVAALILHIFHAKVVGVEKLSTSESCIHPQKPLDQDVTTDAPVRSC